MLALAVRGLSCHAKTMQADGRSSNLIAIVRLPFRPNEFSGKDQYPSPAELEYRVIVKHKKLGTDIDSVLDSNHEEGDIDIADSLKNGYLLVEEVDGNWTKHFFVLTDSKLVWADNQDDDDEVEAEEEEDEVVGDEKENELHYGEAWFHGSLAAANGSGGRGVAQEMIYGFMRASCSQFTT